MRIGKRILSIMIMSLLIFSTISIFWVPLSQVSAQGVGSLTGIIYDSGVDTDTDGTFDFLEVGVEVNVSTSGMFRVEVSGLYDSTYFHISVWGENFTYLDVGIHVVYVSLDGPTIYASGLNPASVSSIYLYDEDYNWLDDLHDVPLSKEYSYTEFDLPPAFLTGTIYDSGVDTDIDGTFDYLRVGVEVNVTAPGTFRVMVHWLRDSGYNYISVQDQNSTYLDFGVHIVYLFLDGPTIYVSGLNPAYVPDIHLDDEYDSQLDYLYDVPLSKEYSYTEFDLPPAFLTGTIYDMGLDTDGDGAFDYLEVGVEVNVTDSGDYGVDIWGLLDSGHNYISVSGYESKYLDAGIQVVNVLLYGPTIYVSGLNPVNVSEIELSSVEYALPFQLPPPRNWFGSVYDVPLSQEYLYTEFDSPFSDMEAIFVVYPDGRVVMGAALNYTNMEPPYTEPPMYGIAEIRKSDTLTLVSANFTLIIPPEEASQFPFNSSAFTLLSEYSGGLLTTTIDGSTIFPPGIASEFPFNITDFTVVGEYIGNMVDGNIIVDIWNGFPLDDIEIDFQGNNTYVHLNGSTTVIFGDYPDFGELNATVLEELLQNLTSTIGGQGPDSLYNMTDGLLKFTMLNNVTTLHNGNATVDFEAKVEGDLIQTLGNMTGQPASMYVKMLNTTLSSVENASFLLTYSHAFKEADMNLEFVANITDLIDKTVLILPDIPDIPPEMVTIIEYVLNTTTYCSVESAEFSLSYEDSTAILNATVVIDGDFDAEINYIKSLFLTYGVPQPLTSQLQTLNETQIDLTNFRIGFNINETVMEVDFSGVAVRPPIDVINATSFKLWRFFNITASEYEPPGEGERLKVTVEGGSNGTHTIRIFRPPTVPEPDTSAPGGMVWNNQSISGLKDLIFQIGSPDNTPPNIGTPIHTPEIPDDGEDVTVSVNVTDDDTGVRPDGVILSYSTDDGETWINVTMSKATGDTYEGIIPGLAAGTQVKYMIIAYDYAGNGAVENNAGAYYVYTVIPEFPTWQIIAFTLLLIGIIVVLAKKRQNIAKNRLKVNQLFSIFR